MTRSAESMSRLFEAAKHMSLEAFAKAFDEQRKEEEEKPNADDRRNPEEGYQ